MRRVRAARREQALKWIERLIDLRKQVISFDEFVANLTPSDVVAVHIAGLRGSFQINDPDVSTVSAVKDMLAAQIQVWEEKIDECHREIEAEYNAHADS
jgi:hypothetical protein